MAKVETPEMAALQHHLNKETVLSSGNGLAMLIFGIYGPFMINEGIKNNDPVMIFFGFIATVSSLGFFASFVDHMVDMNKTITDINQLESHYRR